MVIGHELVFDWTQSFVNAQLSVAATATAFQFSWDDYKSWDIGMVVLVSGIARTCVMIWLLDCSVVLFRLFCDDQYY